MGHSMMTVPSSADRNPVTKLTRSGVTANADFFEFSDSPGTGVSRVRAVLFLKDPDVIVSLDRASSKTKQSFQTLWHLPPGQTATVTSRAAAVAMAPGAATRTVVLQVPYRQVLPAGATLVKQGQTNPRQGWYWPTSNVRQAAPTVLLARSGTSAAILSLVIPIRATGQIKCTTRMSGTTFVVDLDVGGQRVSFGVSGGGSLFRIGG